MQALLDFLAIKYLVPFGYHLNWNQAVLWLNVASDVVIVVVCYVIALSLAIMSSDVKMTFSIMGCIYCSRCLFLPLPVRIYCR